MALNNIINKLFKKFYGWWVNMSKGSFIIIDKNNKHKLLKKKQDLVDPDIKYIIWGAMSTDDLTFFIYYILYELDAKEIEKLLVTKNTLEYFLSDIKRFFKKSELFDDKNITKNQYVLKGNMKNTKNERKIIKSLESSTILKKLILKN